MKLDTTWRNDLRAEKMRRLVNNQNPGIGVLEQFPLDALLSPDSGAVIVKALLPFVCQNLHRVHQKSLVWMP